MANDYTEQPCYSQRACSLMRRINALEDVYPVTFPRLAIYDGFAWLYSPQFARVVKYDLATWTLQDFFPTSTYVGYVTGFGGDIAVTDQGVFLTTVSKSAWWVQRTTTLSKWTHSGTYIARSTIGNMDIYGVGTAAHEAISGYGDTISCQVMHYENFLTPVSRIRVFSAVTLGALWDAGPNNMLSIYGTNRTHCQDEDAMYCVINAGLGLSRIEAYDRGTGELLRSGPDQIEYAMWQSQIVGDGGNLYLLVGNTGESRAVKVIDKTTLREIDSGPLVSDNAATVLHGATSSTLYGIRPVYDDTSDEYVVDIDATTYEITATRRIEEDNTAQTRWYGYGSVSKTPLTLPDGGVSAPGDNELIYGDITLSTQILLDLRTAVRKLASSYVDVDTGNPFNWTKGNPSNLYYKAMGSRTKYGATGGAKYDWTRGLYSLTKDDLTLYDIDIGEVEECVTLLESSAKVP